ncbi:hypothetical protein SAMN05421769_2675 [Chryseobacterium scophthalmum]|uniref:Uncharacterized protein n=1 Tax=Chryseobacterium scophthalmum TaxID=59733 RepID=A0A1N6HMV8_9FLAO|nr:hypothetical protein SAMN05421769_2675 [Chryseobacterium scophthalmum]
MENDLKIKILTKNNGEKVSLNNIPINVAYELY